VAYARTAAPRFLGRVVISFDIMPKLLVSLPGMRHQVYLLSAGDTVIGRGDDARVRIPHVSVSRAHARVRIERGSVTIADLGSGNGTLVNGATIDGAHPLASRDRIQVGRHTLVFLSDGPKDAFYQGRAVKHLPLYSAEALEKLVDHSSTVAMNPEVLAAYARGDNLADMARVVSEQNEKAYWYPDTYGLTFGEAADVRVRGWFIFGCVARITFESRMHVLHPRRFWVPVRVNGEDVEQRHALRKGDRFTIGSSAFRYVVE
jgi:pSer/pThr/pTyr-binding forkhead associated (FHA) protein